MATKKQQRRKYQRALGRGRLHEGYEPRAGDDDGGKLERTRERTRGRGQPPRPTWLRAVRRAGLFSLGLFVFVQLIPIGGSSLELPAAALQAASFFVFLVPFGYLMDTFLYNRWLKRQQG
jgi:hypothetical protein